MNVLPSREPRALDASNDARAAQAPGTGRPPTDDFWAKVRRIRRRPVYVAASFLIALVAAMGFAPGVIRKLLDSKVPRDAIIHIHVAVYSVWLILFSAQTINAALGRMGRHRKLGKVLISYGGLMFVVGMAVTINRFVTQVHDGHPEIARTVNLAPFVDMLFFPFLFGFAVHYRRSKPEVHKRLMILTATMLTYPAMVRIEFPPFMRHYPVFLLIWTAPVLLGIAHDWLTRRLIHPAYVAGMLILFVSSLRPTLVGSHLWLGASGWLTTVIQRGG